MLITSFRPTAVAPRAASAPPAPVPREETDPDEEALKRAFVWGAAGLTAGALSSVATTAAYAFGGPVAGEITRWSLTLAGGVAGAVYFGERMSAKPPRNRVMGFLAGASAAGLTTFMGAQAGMAGGFLTGLVAAQASAGFGMLYCGYGALLLNGKQEA
ncbi:MAG: hypothetical protein AB1758_19275 [Candidatus Eremiobacterota bacterium]